jgi:hypothetical protein
VDDETAARPAPHLGDPVVFDEANRLAEYGAADAVALSELNLSTDDLADRPTRRNDVVLDGAGQDGRPLVIDPFAASRPR